MLPSLNANLAIRSLRSGRAPIDIAPAFGRRALIFGVTANVATVATICPVPRRVGHRLRYGNDLNLCSAGAAVAAAPANYPK